MRFTLIVFSFVIQIPLFAQKDFKWEYVDTTDKAKSEIYSKTKLFIAKEWKSAKSVIQNDDKEAGIVLVKGVSSHSILFVELYEYKYNYSYDVLFRIKDNKFKLTIDNVYCEAAYQVHNNVQLTKIEPFEGDNCPYTGGVSKKKVIEMMTFLRKDLQAIVDDYVKYLRTTTKEDDF